MARIVIKCKYTGHYVITPIDTDSSPTIVAGCVPCPYCRIEHVRTVENARINEWQKKAPKLIVRQASLGNSWNRVFRY